MGIFHRATTHISRRQYIENARMLNGIKDQPANHQPDDIVAYGRYPYPLRFEKKLDVAPPFPRMKVSSFLNVKPTRTFDVGLVLLMALSFVMLGLVLILRGEMM